MGLAGDPTDRFPRRVGERPNRPLGHNGTVSWQSGQPSREIGALIDELPGGKELQDQTDLGFRADMVSPMRIRKEAHWRPTALTMWAGLGIPNLAGT